MTAPISLFNRLKQWYPLCLSLFTLILLSISCEKDPTFLGKNMIPSSDLINTRIDSTIVVKAFTSKSPALNTIANARLLLGELTDPVYGKNKAEILLPVFPYKSDSLGTGRVIDSLILELKLDGHYGDTLAQTLRIFELSQKLSVDSSYFSDQEINGMYDPQELANTGFHPNDTLIRLNITNPDFLNKFLTTHDSVYKDAYDFGNNFKGFYFTTDPVAGSGSITYIDSLLNESSLILYYKNDSTLAKSDTINRNYRMVFINIAPKANVFTNDFTGSRASLNLDSASSSDSLLFVAGMASLQVNISFPEIENWKDSTNIAINKAELIIPLSTDVTQNEALIPSRLMLTTKPDGDKDVRIFDYIIDNTSSSNKVRTIFNGYYKDIKKGAYVFNVGRHLQAYLNDETDSFDLVLTVNQANLLANRAVLTGPVQGKKGIQLKITYTKL